MFCLYFATSGNGSSPCHSMWCFATLRNGSSSCHSMWCGSCYTSAEGIGFYVRQDPRLVRAVVGEGVDRSAVGGVDEDCLGNYWSTSKPGEKAFHYARNGDHLLVAFECALCVFSKIRPGERPDLTNERNTLLLAAIKRVNLDSFGVEPLALWTGPVG
jgi:hypothetical protein